MTESEVKGKTGVFSFNPDQAMDWLTTNKNVFTVLCYITLRKNFRRSYGNIPLKSNEVYVCFKDWKIQPKITISQWKRCLDNLSFWGFIEINEFKPVHRTAGVKKITILVDIFSHETSSIVHQYVNEHGGGYFT